jgi:hypothetical protein
MGQATRTIKLPLALDKRRQGGANTGKRAYLEATVVVLNAARAFYIAFFLTLCLRGISVARFLISPPSTAGR